MLTPPQRSRWQSLAAAAPTLLAVALLIVAGRWFVDRWREVGAQAGPIAITWGWLAVAAALLVLHAGTALVTSRVMLVVADVRLTWGQAADVFVPSLLARYVPGRVWANAARLALGRRIGVSLRSAGAAMVWETLVALATAGTVAALMLRGRIAPALWWTAAGCAVGLFAVTIVFVRLRRPARGLFAATVVAFLGWGCFAAAHLAVARSVASVGLSDLPLIAGAMALAWSAGYLAIVVPLGIGVRDGLLLVLLASLFDPAAALVFVALARVVQLGVDLALTSAWLLARRARAIPAAARDTRDPRATVG
jgi:hypothetical protein